MSNKVVKRLCELLNIIKNVYFSVQRKVKWGCRVIKSVLSGKINETLCNGRLKE
jgi:hypothetical protein